MLQGKPLVRLLAGAAAVGAGIVALRARRQRGPESILPSAPMPPTPAGEAPAELPRPEAVPAAELPAQPPGPEVELTEVPSTASSRAEPEAEPRGGKASGKPKPSAAKPAGGPRAKPSRAPRAKPSRAPGAKKAASSTAAPSAAQSRTREELYREAKRLGIEGRSKMSKGELERAVAKASGG